MASVVLDDPVVAGEAAGEGAVFEVVLPLIQAPVMGVEPEAAYLAGR